MNLQINGNESLAQQELQLQSIETFFVEIIDYQASSSTLNNDVTTSNVTAPNAHRIQLKVIQVPGDLAHATSGVSSIVFDRMVFVAGQRQRVLGFRA